MWDPRVPDGPVLTSLIETGRSVKEEDYAALEAVRGEFSTALDSLLNDVDVLLAPCMPVLPPTVEEMSDPLSFDESRADLLTFTAPFNYSGHPTISLPAGLAADGLPKSIQLIGRKLAEPTLIRAGSAYERLVEFNQHPVT